MRDGQPLVNSSRHFYPLLHDTLAQTTTTASTTRSRVVSQGLTPMNIEAIRRARSHQGGLCRRRGSGRDVSERKQVGDAASLVSGEPGGNGLGDMGTLAPPENHTFMIPLFQFSSKVVSEARMEEEQNIEKSRGQVLISLPFHLFPTPSPPIPLYERVEWVWPILHTSHPDIPPG
ncbi:hypothetical protein I7I51_03347 [Histoplasma capsulatum]|uniref:Uncharacterized protein n=1 Tax=Ajellomyces capsulatus TaxID=5037 RepID=A0A8A1M676_AJECA|nr:hypothetical protein I7I51_03347 [Histoplasma capsulatum]